MRLVCWGFAGMMFSACTLFAVPSSANDACEDLTAFVPKDTRIQSAVNMETETQHCKVAGVIEKEIKFELLLP